MTCYAKVVSGIVTDTIVASAGYISAFPDAGDWIETDPNTIAGVHLGANGAPDGGTALRGNYAGVGYTYDATHDVFYPPQPFPSWSIAAPSWTWTPPVAMPATGGPYVWVEASQSWQSQAP